MHASSNVCVYVCLYACACVYVCVCMHACLHTCICVCLPVYVCIYTYKHSTHTCTGSSEHVPSLKSHCNSNARRSSQPTWPYFAKTCTTSCYVTFNVSCEKEACTREIQKYVSICCVHVPGGGLCTETACMKRVQYCSSKIKSANITANVFLQCRRVQAHTYASYQHVKGTVTGTFWSL